MSHFHQTHLHTCIQMTQLCCYTMHIRDKDMWSHYIHFHLQYRLREFNWLHHGTLNNEQQN